MVEPFEDDELAAKVGQLVGLTLGVGKGEIRGGFAGFHRRKSGKRQGNKEKKKELIHCHQDSTENRGVKLGIYGTGIHGRVLRRL